MVVNKRGQITIFIILGIIILFASASYFYLSRQSKEIKEEIVPSLTEVPFEVRPVRDYIQSCVSRIGEDGIRLIGLHGGYIDPLEADIKVNPAEPTESDAVDFLPDANIAIPYWWYLKDDNKCEGTCQFDTKRPPLSGGSPHSIQRQIERYVEEHLSECLENPRELAKQKYRINEMGTPIAKAYIFRDRVSLFVEYPLEVFKAETRFTIHDYIAEIDVALEPIYELASEVANLQATHNFLEKHMWNVISVFSAVDEEKLPPPSAVTFEFGGGITWQRSTVYEQLKQLLVGYIPVLQIVGVDNFRPIVAINQADPDLANVLYNRGAIIPLNKTYSGIEASLVYLDMWKPYIDLNCDGETCKSESISNTFLAVFGVQRYQFAYDVSFPVMLRIRQPRAMNDRGFDFFTMIEANMRNNKPMKSKYEPLRIDLGDMGVTTLLCSHRTSGEVTIKVTDGKTRKPLSDAKIILICGDETCAPGKTNEKGEFKGPLPRCFGSFIGIQKNGYAGRNIPYSTTSTNKKSFNIVLEPYRDLNLDVKKLPLRKSGEDYLPEALKPVTDDDSITVIMTKHVGPWDEGYTATGHVFGKDEKSTIRLIPGDYEVRINNVYMGDFEIPEQEKCEQVLFDEECVTIPGTKFGPTQPMPSGGAVFNWTLTKTNIDRGKKVTFKTLVFDFPAIPKQKREMTDLEAINKVEPYSKIYRGKLEPIISS